MSKSQRYVSLTFDDGPSLYTHQILDVLKSYQVQATFFLIGNEAEKFPELTKRIDNEGHIIGNHTRRHPDLTLLSKKELKEEISIASEQIKHIIGASPALFRPPFGKLSKQALQTIKEMGMTNVLWNVNSLDWLEYMPAELVHQRILATLRKNSIILMHDGTEYGSGARNNTVAALPKVIGSLKELQYRFVTIPEFYQQAFPLEEWDIWLLSRLLADPIYDVFRMKGLK
ncbi:polysaccharide deacetylase family protein [Metabacillus sp. 84]|uniref:polysaccharide deacetylase family protein n=1 Tax=unclassified Metabacillus TaxID=2675274 RepID=UPI003CF3870E